MRAEACRLLKQSMCKKKNAGGSESVHTVEQQSMCAGGAEKGQLQQDHSCPILYRFLPPSPKVTSYLFLFKHRLVLYCELEGGGAARGGLGWGGLLFTFFIL